MYWNRKKERLSQRDKTLETDALSMIEITTMTLKDSVERKVRRTEKTR